MAALVGDVMSALSPVILQAAGSGADIMQCKGERGEVQFDRAGGRLKITSFPYGVTAFEASWAVPSVVSPVLFPDGSSGSAASGNSGIFGVAGW